MTRRGRVSTNSVRTTFTSSSTSEAGRTSTMNVCGWPHRLDVPIPIPRPICQRPRPIRASSGSTRPTSLPRASPMFAMPQMPARAPTRGCDNCVHGPDRRPLPRPCTELTLAVADDSPEPGRLGRGGVDPAPGKDGDPTARRVDHHGVRLAAGHADLLVGAGWSPAPPEALAPAQVRADALTPDMVDPAVPAGRARRRETGGLAHRMG